MRNSILYFRHRAEAGQRGPLKRRLPFGPVPEPRRSSVTRLHVRHAHGSTVPQLLALPERCEQGVQRRATAERAERRIIDADRSALRRMCGLYKEYGR